MNTPPVVPSRRLEEVACLLADAAEIVFDLRSDLPDPDDADGEVAEWLRPALMQMDELRDLVHRAGNLADTGAQAHGALPVSRWWNVL